MMGDLGSARLKVRPDVFFVRTSEGTWLRNDLGSFFVKGVGSYDFLRSLMAHLDGTRTLDDVCHTMGITQRATLHEKLLKPLMRNGFLREAPLVPELPPTWIKDRYGEQLAFLERYVDRPLECFLRTRSRPIACIGSGLLLRAAAVALAEMGFAHVHVLAATSAEYEASLLRDVVSAAAAEDAAEWKLALHPRTISLDELAYKCRKSRISGVVLATADAEPAEVASSIATLLGRNLTVGVLAAAGGFVLASPLINEEEWCWECVFRSVVSDMSLEPAPPSAALGALQVAQRLFCRLAGPPVPEDHHLATIDCRTLAVQVHTPRRNGACPRPHDVPEQARSIDFTVADDTPIRPDIASYRDAEEVIAIQDAIVESTSGWIDPVIGPLLTVGEEELAQLPLSASRCRIRDPANLPGVPAVRTLECRSVAPREARNQVVLFALEWLAAATVQHRGKPIDFIVFGAGWSIGEAIYRAWASASLHCLLDRPTAAGGKREELRLGASPLTKFLADTLTDAGCDRPHVRVEKVVTGFVGARILAGGEMVGCGIGLAQDQAVDHALIDAVARRAVPAGIGRGVVAHPSPLAGHWGEVLGLIDKQACYQYIVSDVAYLLPFLQDRARIVALSPAAHTIHGTAAK